MATVEFCQIRKSFGSMEVVKGVDLKIADGEFFVLVGPSGCGKSTLLRMIAGLEEVTSGELRIGDKVVNTVSARDRDVAMVFQSYALYPHMTVRRNMAFALEVRKVRRSEIEAQVAAVARLLGLEELLDRYPKQLSGGQRQRVAMGRAIVRKPNVFLFDEPLSNLDAALRAQMRVELARLHRKLGTTILYVTHDQVEAMTLADRIAVLDGGILQQVGKPWELYDRPKNRFVAHFLGSPTMNFIEAQLDDTTGGIVATGDINGTRFKLDTAPSRIAKAGRPGRKVFLGVRPHDFQIVTNQEGVGLPETVGIEAVVDVIEPMGWEALVYLTLGEKTLVVHSKAESVSRLKPSQKVQLVVAPDQMHVFDYDSERNLLWI